MSEWVDFTASSNWSPKLIALAPGDHSGYSPAQLWGLCTSSLSADGGSGNVPPSGLLGAVTSGGYTWDGTKWAAPSTMLQNFGDTNTPILRQAVLQFAGTLPAALLGVRVTAKTQTTFAGGTGDYYDIRMPYLESSYGEVIGNAASDPGDTLQVLTVVFADLDQAFLDNFAQTFLDFNGFDAYDDVLPYITAMVSTHDDDNILIDGHDNNLMHIIKVEFLLDTGFWTSLVGCEVDA